jgi:hypothetical protein
MTNKLLTATVLVCGLVAGQQPPARPAQSTPDRVQSGRGDDVAVDPKQPYRPIPANRVQQRETIFEFYLRALNPHRIRWGEEINRRLTMLAQHSIGNPYFRLCAVQMALVLLLLMICWLWWDKMRQIKWVAAECLADAINAKRIADSKALEAIGHYNRHIEMCNRVIESHESGIASGSGTEEWQRQVRDLQTQVTAERAKSAQLEADLKERHKLQSQMERRLQQLEETMRDRQGTANAELVARLQRAEAELAGRKAPRS